MALFSNATSHVSAIICAMLLVTPTAKAQTLRTIQNDGGGIVNAYVIKANLAVLRGDKIRIDGWCASACTAYLGNPNTCVTQSAKFGFHGPTGGSTQENRRAAMTLARHLPATLQHWYLAKAANLHGNDYIAVSAEELVGLGAAQWC